MSEIDQIDIPQVPQGGLKAPLMVAGGGLAAAFCAASCCGLPVLLGSLGLGSGWLVTIAWIAAPHRIALLIAAVILLLGGAGAFVWRRRVVFCATEISTGRLVASVLLVGILLIGGGLVVLGYLYA